MKEVVSNVYYLEKAPIKKAIAHLSIPMMVGMSAGTIYNLVNAYFIGLVHDTAMLSAITLCLPIFTILMAFGNMFGVGGGTFITRLVAAGDGEKARKVAGYSFYGSIIAGMVMAGIAWLVMTPLVHLLGADALTFEYTRQYTFVMFLGGFAILGNFALEQLVRAGGASKESMYGMFVSIVLSILLDVLFILILNWHVVGAALSIILANIGSAVYYVWYLETKSGNLKGFLRHFKLKGKDQGEVYKIGVSELIQASFLLVTTLLLNNYSMQYGDTVVASFGIALRIVQVPEFLSMGLFFGIIPLIAYNFSNKNIPRLKSGIKHAALYIAAISGVFAGIVFLFKGQVLHFFSNDPSVLSIGGYILAAMLISALFNGFTGLFTGIFQASGQGVSSTVMAVAQGVLFIPVVIVLHHVFGLHGVVWSMTITEVITCLLGMILFVSFTKKINVEDGLKNEMQARE
ncbi:putative MATE family efflux protein [Fontibacillus phaseoli]|uniref:Multidrug export protein MepA n=1 Tax=Fontibacillus phaseoli TaxID=1416533 RepID=A0A369B867_9BACL|nr:MATE family efflux transporter [Fontibacillus phaseoli]RCX17720.1 putative MATE family efflux protein [Fontibacillus phaseoli]